MNNTEINAKLTQMIHDKRFLDFFVLARYFYRIGQPVISDKLYDNLEAQLKSQYNDSAYFSQTYDDDPVPTELLTELGVGSEQFFDSKTLKELSIYLNDDKSLSMRSVTDNEEAFKYFSMLRRNKLDFMASLKTDGVNTKMLYVDGKLAVSMSRGRGDATSFDYMTGSKLIMPKEINNYNGILHLRITGESYVDKAALEHLRDKYDSSKYKTSKSAAISMLRVKHEVNDYKALHTAVFAAEGLEPTLSETFAHLESEGFEVVPYQLHSWQEIPESFEEFTKWVHDDVMTPIAKAGEGMPSDGCAIEVNDFSWLGEQQDQYSTRQLALKYDYWAFKVYRGYIKDIKVEQRRVYKSVRVEIEPIVTDDDCKAQIINVFNMSILIDNDLYIGKEVYFEKNAGAVNILIHGQRLQGILDDN